MSNEAKPLNSKMSFDEFKLNSDGMLTVVVQGIIRQMKF